MRVKNKGKNTGKIPKIRHGNSRVKRVYHGNKNVYGDWKPDDLTDLYIWLDASDTDSDSISESTTSGRVSTWHDKSGNDRDFSSGGGNSWNTAIADTQPYTSTRTLNGLNVIDFRGDEFLRSDDTLGTQTYCIFMIGAMDSIPATNSAIIGIGNSSPRGDLHSKSTSEFLALFTKNIVENYQFLDSGTSIAPGDEYFLSLHVDATANTVELFKDGTTAGSTTHFDTFRTNVNNRLILYNYRQAGVTDSNHTIGFRNSGTIDGCLGEVIVTDVSVSATDRQKIEGYLAHKWGMTDKLPSDHPYKTAWPTT